MNRGACPSLTKRKTKKMVKVTITSLEMVLQKFEYNEGEGKLSELSKKFPSGKITVVEAGTPPNFGSWPFPLLMDAEEAAKLSPAELESALYDEAS